MIFLPQLTRLIHCFTNCRKHLRHRNCRLRNRQNHRRRYRPATKPAATAAAQYIPQDCTEKKTCPSARSRAQQGDEDEDHEDGQQDIAQTPQWMWCARGNIPQRLRLKSDARIFCDDLSDVLGSQRDRRIVIALAQIRHHFAADRSDFTVGQNSFQAVSDFKPVMVVVGRNQEKQAAVGTLRPHLPLFFQPHGEIVNGVIAGRMDGHDGNLGVGLVIDFCAKRFQAAARRCRQHPGEIVHIAGGLQIADLFRSGGQGKQQWGDE